MLSRLLNCSLIYLLLVLDHPEFQTNVTYVLLVGLCLSSLFTPGLIVRTIKSGVSRKILSVAELEPSSYAYGQRVLLARLVPVILLIEFAFAGNWFMIFFSCLNYLLLEYYIYQIRLYNSVCLDLLEQKFYRE